MTKSDQTADFVMLWNASSRQVYAFILSLLPNWADADEALNRWGQSEERWSEAWVIFGHFDAPGGAEYPDRILHYDATRDRVRVERT